MTGELNTAMAIGERGHHWGPPGDSCSPSFPPNPPRGVSLTTIRTMENAVGDVNPPILGKRDCQVYSSSDGIGGASGDRSAQQVEEPWQRRGFLGDCDRFAAAHTSPPAHAQSVVQWARNCMDGTDMTKTARYGWPSSLGCNRSPGGRDCARYTAEEEEGKRSEDNLGCSFRRLSSSSSALSSTAQVPTLLMPSPSPDVDRWRRDNPQIQPPSSVSVSLPPRLEHLERLVFAEDFTTVSAGPSTRIVEEQKKEEGKDVQGNA